MSGEFLRVLPADNKDAANVYMLVADLGFQLPGRTEVQDSRGFTETGLPGLFFMNR